MVERYPGYDVLAKRQSPSWNDKTRAVIEERLQTDPDRHLFFNDAEWLTFRSLCDRIIPQVGAAHPPVPVAALVDQKLAAGKGDGYRDSRLPPAPEAWRRGLGAIDAEAENIFHQPFHQLKEADQNSLLKAIQTGHAKGPAWRDLPPTLFFAKHILHDIVSAYYTHPYSWSEIGFGGPASPRGYVRLGYNMRDPWEPAEAVAGREEEARRLNVRIR